MRRWSLVLVAAGTLVALGMSASAGTASSSLDAVDPVEDKAQTGQFPLCAHYNFLEPGDSVGPTGPGHFALGQAEPRNFAGYVDVDPNERYKVTLDDPQGQTIHIDFYDENGESTGVKGSDSGEVQGVPPNSDFGFVCVDDRSNIVPSPGEDALPGLLYFAVPDVDAQWTYHEVS